ncbi:MAG: ferritin-like domain-containing protein, partial [Vulcanimicrobiaceae bacterium]
MSRGAITNTYELNPADVVKILNEALATEIVCVLRYKRHFYSAKGLNKDAVAAEFLQHATEEQGHADRIS